MTENCKLQLKSFVSLVPELYVIVHSEEFSQELLRQTCVIRKFNILNNDTANATRHNGTIMALSIMILIIMTPSIMPFHYS